MTADLPPGHPVQSLSDAVHEVLVTQTPVGLMIGDRTAPRVMVSDGPLGGTAAGLLTIPDAIAYPTTRTIVIGPQPARLVRTAELAGARAALTPRQQAQMQLLVHEHLHMTTSGETALNGGRQSASIEEAAVDAVTADVTPQVVRTLTGQAPAADPGDPHAYPACVADIRLASTVATASRSWRDLGAALWRMRLVMAPPAERVAMLARTGTGPEVCS